MGKRELILIAVFVILGVGVYQVTAPPPAPGERDFSLSGLLDSVRKEVRGRPASAELNTSTTHPLAESITEMRVAVRAPVTVIGEDRTDIEAQLSVRSNGVDEAEARQLAAETKVTYDASGSIIALGMFYPEGGSQTVRGLSLKVPSRLRVRIEPSTQKLQLSNLADVELTLARGDVNIRQVRGRVTGTHRGGDINIADAGSVKLTTRGSDARIEQIRGESTINAQAGDLRTTGLVGPVEIESNATDVTLEGLEKTTGAIRINAAGGSIVLKGLSTETRLDVRNGDVEMDIARPAPIAVYSEGGDPVVITAPPGGFRVDAVSREATIRSMPEDLLQQWGLALAFKGDNQENRASGAVNGGGPLLTVRASGPITFRAR